MQDNPNYANNPSNPLASDKNGNSPQKHLEDAPWHFKQALHIGEKDVIEGLLNNPDLTVNRRNLLKGMLLAWQGDKKAKSLLGALVRTAGAIDKTWASLVLSAFCLSIGEYDYTTYYNSVCQKAYNKASRDNSLPPYLTALIKLWDGEYALSQGQINVFDTNKTISDITSIINTLESSLIKGYGYYLLAKLSTEVVSALDNFYKAINLLQNVDFYYLSLSQIEVAKIASLELSERCNLLSLAQESLKKIEKSFHSNVAKSLLSDISSISSISSKSSRIDGQNVANCLFISPKMREIKAKVETFAKYSLNDCMLVLGEKGTGKEKIALTVKELTGKKLITINCSTLTETLFESTVFGHKKGAFTGATEDKAGLLEIANGEILFLDEIGDLQKQHQAKLLRVLQSGDFFRLGEEGKVVRLFSAKVIAATNKDLEKMIKEDSFQGDLFDRLNYSKVVLPPLDKRKEEIIPLAEFFLSLHSRGEKFVLTNKAKDFLLSKSYPANIRGLEMEIKRSVAEALSKGVKVITEHMFEKPSTPSLSENNTGKSIEDIEPFQTSMDNHARKLILEALNICGGNKSLTMNCLEIPERNFYRLVGRLGMKNLSVKK